MIRGLFYEDPAEKPEATANYANVRSERFMDPTPTEERVLGYLIDFYSRHAEPPSYAAAHDHFENAGLPEETALIEESGGNQFYTGGSFADVVEEVVEGQANLHMKRRVREALDIYATGTTLPNGDTVKGHDAAVAHLFTSLRTVPPRDTGQIPSDMSDAADGLRDLYEHRKANPSAAFGVMTGYPSLDSRVGGLRKKALYIHAGFANHLKSTFLLNQSIHAVTAGYNVLLFSSEMPADDVQYLAVAIHSGDPKYRAQGRAPLDAKAVLSGTLGTPEREDFFREVLEDLARNPAHGSLRVIDSAEFTTWGSVMQRTVREHALKPVDVLWIDYLTRLPLDAKYARMEHSHGMNLTIAEAKQFAMSFDGGQGLAVATAFQINREGLRTGKRTEGKLDATALGQYNAAEKEADWISYSWYGETQREEHACLVGMIKNRHGPVMLEPVSMFYDETCRRIDETGGTVRHTGVAGGIISGTFEDLGDFIE